MYVPSKSVKDKLNLPFCGHVEKIHWIIDLRKMALDLRKNFFNKFNTS